MTIVNSYHFNGKMCRRVNGFGKLTRGVVREEERDTEVVGRTTANRKFKRIAIVITVFNRVGRPSNGTITEAHKTKSSFSTDYL